MSFQDFVDLGIFDNVMICILTFQIFITFFDICMKSLVKFTDKFFDDYLDKFYDFIFDKIDKYKNKKTLERSFEENGNDC